MQKIILKKSILKIILVTGSLLLITGFSVSAQINEEVFEDTVNMSTIRERFDTTTGRAGYFTTEEIDEQGIAPERYLQYQIAHVVGLSMILLGVIFLGLTLYGGALWMLSRGNEEQVSKAIRIIKNGVIGIILIASSYVIVFFITESILRATQDVTSIDSLTNSDVDEIPETDTTFTDDLSDSWEDILSWGQWVKDFFTIEGS